MPFANVYNLKILVYVLFLLSSFVLSEGAMNVKHDTSKAVYKKFLKMRTLPFEDCGSTYDILYLSISSCNMIPCEMHRGSKVLVNVIFDDYGRNTNYLRHRVSWVFNAIKTAASISPDPCDGAHECLISSSDGKSYNAMVAVNNTLPCIRGQMVWEAIDEHGSAVICFRVPVVITQ